MRGLMILVGGLIGAALGVGLAVLLLDGLRAQGGGGPAWEMTLIGSLGGLCALVFAILTAWLTASAETEHLAVGPTRHLLTVTMMLLGGAGGLILYLALASMAGGADAMPPAASRVFAGALTALGALAGLGAGRLVAVRAYY